MRLRATWLATMPLALLLALLPGFGAPRADGAPQREILVYAAASLTDVLEHLGDEFTREHGTAVKFSFAGTSMLAKQIESGARPDVFISADQDWMDYVDQRRLIDHASRTDLLANRLVLIAPAESRVSLKIAPGFPLRDALGKHGRLSVADPASVPAGRYARSALTALGVWNSIESRLAASENVRTALLYVARGEAPLGIVYLTDARADAGVRVVDEFPESTHPRIIYPAALTASGSKDGAAFLNYLRGAAAAEAFRRAGFELATPRPPASGPPSTPPR